MGTHPPEVPHKPALAAVVAAVAAAYALLDTAWRRGNRIASAHGGGGGDPCRWHWPSIIMSAGAAHLMPAASSSAAARRSSASSSATDAGAWAASR